MNASDAASRPGQVTPAPSPLQKMPKAVSITPTPNFSVFSGTRESGACTTMPASSTTTKRGRRTDGRETHVVAARPRTSPR